MGIHAKYVQTNLVAKNWLSLVAFYQEIFGCILVPPERDLSGEKLEAETGLPGARLRGAFAIARLRRQRTHVGDFQLQRPRDRPKTAVNRPGLGHIAFSVDDVAVAQRAVLDAGGKAVGEIVTMEIATDEKVIWC